MALTRGFLEGLGLNKDQVNAIIEAHTETVDGLKTQITDANTQKQEAVEALNAAKSDGWEQKYSELSTQFETYKADVTAKAAKAAKATAYTELLKAAGVADKRISAVLKVTDIDKLELDDKGKLKDPKALTDSIKSEWADFITVTETHGADVQQPPKENNGTGAVTADQFKKMSYNQRLELFRSDPETYNALTKE